LKPFKKNHSEADQININYSYPISCWTVVQIEAAVPESIRNIRDGNISRTCHNVSMNAMALKDIHVLLGLDIHKVASWFRMYS